MPMSLVELHKYIVNNISTLEFEQVHLSQGNEIAKNTISNVSCFGIDYSNNVIAFVTPSNIMPLELSHHYVIGSNNNVEHLIFIADEKVFIWFKVINYKIENGIVYFTFLEYDTQSLIEEVPVEIVKPVSAQEKLKKLCKFLDIKLNKLSPYISATKMYDRANKNRLCGLSIKMLPMHSETFFQTFKNSKNKTLKQLIANIENLGIVVEMDNPREINFYF